MIPIWRYHPLLFTFFFTLQVQKFLVLFMTILPHKSSEGITYIFYCCNSTKSRNMWHMCYVGGMKWIQLITFNSLVLYLRYEQWNPNVTSPNLNNGKRILFRMMPFQFTCIQTSLTIKFLNNIPNSVCFGTS